MAKREETTFKMKQLLIIIILTISVKAFGQDRLLIDNGFGVVEAKIETNKENIVIFNQDCSVWMLFDFDYENKLDNKNQYTLDDVKKLYSWNEDFNPYVFIIDYSLLMFICTGIEGDKYKVIVNKETGLEKYIKKEDFLILRNWQEHLIHSVASVDFDIKTNPVRQKPTIEAGILKLSLDIDPVIEPIGINGDWLKVRFWEKDNEKTGWIKWKIENRIIVSLFYLI